MRNLLLNAIRHTPSEGSIAVSANSDGDGVVRITVSDACGGIPEEDLPRLFASAFRGSAARTAADGQGGGFGLAIARGIVEAHRGAIGRQPPPRMPLRGPPPGRRRLTEICGTAGHDNGSGCVHPTSSGDAT
jgi:signal transduction histidine kinase